MPSVLLRQPLDGATVRTPRGQVFIIPDRCKGCRFCIDFCPRAVLVPAPSVNAKGYHYPVVAEGKDDQCVNCQFCTIVCPEYAIFTRDVGEPAASAQKVSA